jgi:hypothetical protein
MEVNSLEFTCAMRVLINFSVDELRLMKKKVHESLLRKCKDNLIEIDCEFTDFIDKITNIGDHTLPIIYQPAPEMIIPLGDDPTSESISADDEEEFWDTTEDSEVEVRHMEEQLPSGLWPDKLHLEVNTTFATFAIRIDRCNHGEAYAECIIFPFPDRQPITVQWQSGMWHIIGTLDECIIDFGKFLVREIYCLIHFFANTTINEQLTITRDKTMSNNTTGQ